MLTLWDAVSFLENDVRNFLDASEFQGRTWIGQNCPATDVAGGSGLGDPGWSSVLSQLTSYDWAKSGDDAIANRSYHAISSLLDDMQAAAPKTGPLAKLLNQGP